LEEVKLVGGRENEGRREGSTGRNIRGQGETWEGGTVGAAGYTSYLG